MLPDNTSASNQTGTEGSGFLLLLSLEEEEGLSVGVYGMGAGSML